MTILALGFLIPLLVMLPVWAAHNQDRSIWSMASLGELAEDAAVTGSFGGALNAIPFALCAVAALWQFRPSDSKSRGGSLPGLVGLLVGGIGLLASSIYVHAGLWNEWYGPGEPSSTFSLNYFIAPLIGGGFLVWGYALGWLVGWVARAAWRRGGVTTNGGGEW